MNSFFSKGVIQDREKDFPRQATYKGVHDHLTSPVRNFKRDSSSGRKKKPKATKVRIPPMLSDSSQMVTYTTLWSPIGYMENAINHDCRGAGAVPAVFQQGGQRGRKHPPEWGALLGKDTRSL